MSPNTFSFCFADIDPQNLSIKTASGEQLEFQWSEPSLSMISPDVHSRGSKENTGKESTDSTRNTSLPSEFAVAMPTINMNEILGPW